ncbi:MAG: signal peptidase I [Lachnospiraceae bacterium]|nr:signal peptidase I [Lachnospiraceae bacterium]
MGRRVILEKYNYKKRDWLHDSIKFIILFFALFIVFRFVIGVSFVSGDSMEPNLHDGECVIYLRLANHYEPGDVVSMWVPSGEYYVKRVVAVGGDVVDIDDRKVYVNGEELEEDYAIGETERQLKAVIFPYQVRENNIFALGDNREVSMDSRTFGEINKVQIRGKIILKIGKWYINRV